MGKKRFLTRINLLAPPRTRSCDVPIPSERFLLTRLWPDTPNPPQCLLCLFPFPAWQRIPSGKGWCMSCDDGTYWDRDDVDTAHPCPSCPRGQITNSDNSACYVPLGLTLTGPSSSSVQRGRSFSLSAAVTNQATSGSASYATLQVGGLIPDLRSPPAPCQNHSRQENPRPV